jgi:hypothetical protein
MFEPLGELIEAPAEKEKSVGASEVGERRSRSSRSKT